ncbi:MAG: hypothetical protein M3153_00315 [Chloroflexota bacterium]|nr:hypothetical protein [Chloroflexota bacterium]
MDFSKLTQNEKLATYGSLAVIVGALVGLGAAGLGFVAVLAAIGMLAVIFLPQLSTSTKLPGSRGSLMLVLGAVAAVILVLGFLNVLSIFGLLLQNAFIATLFYLIAVVGGVVMAWAGWNEFQSEGGKFQIGTGSSGTGSSGTVSSGTGSSGTVSSGTGSTSADAAPPPATDGPPAVERDDEDRPAV